MNIRHGMPAINSGFPIGALNIKEIKAKAIVRWWQRPQLLASKMLPKLIAPPRGIWWDVTYEFETT